MKRRIVKSITLIMCFAMVLSLIGTFAYADGDDSKLLAITFDDGPSIYTGRLLTELKKRDVKATFFIVGNRAVKFYDEIERMYDDGHQIANHTYSHKYLPRISASEATREITKAKAYLASAAGGNDIYLRLPGGLSNATVKELSGAPIIGWSVDTRDWEVLNADKVCNHIVKYAEDGDIILLHDLYNTSVNGAIRAIDILLKEGYEFVTVEELFRRRGITPQNGVIYSRAANNGTNLPAISDDSFYKGQLSDHPQYKYIKKVLDEGIYKIPENGEFAPDRPITRALFATMLGRYERIQQQITATGYEDVPSDIYQAAYVRWASDNGIMTGTEEGFRPGDTITIGEMMDCLMRYMEYKGFSAEQYDIPDYEDESQVSAEVKDSVNFFKFAGILEKEEVSNCHSDKVATKADAARFICLALEFLEDGHWYIMHNGIEFEQARAEAAAHIAFRNNTFINAIVSIFSK